MKEIYFNYFIFAIIAALVNLATQALIFTFYGGILALYIALFFGTFTGLVTKYILDKKWIFYYDAASKRDDAQKFGLYSIMGIFTTFIFWGTEMAFYHLFNFEGSQYVGGAIGLIIGYIVKYQLDKRFVFRVSV